MLPPPNPKRYNLVSLLREKSWQMNGCGKHFRSDDPQEYKDGTIRIFRMSAEEKETKPAKEKPAKHP